MTSESQFAETLEDFFIDVGIPRKIVSDNAKAKTLGRAKDLYRLYNVKTHQSEPHQQNQNFAENRIGQVKRHTDALMDRTHTPAQWWLLAILYVISLLNIMSSPTHGGKSPYEIAFNQQPDISEFLPFKWWDHVAYSIHNTFPSTGGERSGRWVGVAHNHGDGLAFWILTEDTKELIV